MTDQDDHWRWATPERPPAPGVPTPGPDAGAASTAGVVAGPATVPGAGPTRLERWRDAVADRLPATLRGRWSLDRTTAVVLAVSVLLAAVVLGGWSWLRDRPHELAVARTHPAAQGTSGGDTAPMPELPPPRAAPAQPPRTTSPAPVPLPLPQNGSTGGVVVDVEGKVARPGVRTL